MLLIILTFVMTFTTKGYDIELAYEAVFYREMKKIHYFDRFRDRIMFPLNNAQGRIVGYSGRTYNNQEPKYLTTGNTHISKEDYYIILIMLENIYEKMMKPYY